MKVVGLLYLKICLSAADPPLSSSSFTSSRLPPVLLGRPCRRRRHPHRCCRLARCSPHQPRVLALRLSLPPPRLLPPRQTASSPVRKQPELGGPEKAEDSAAAARKRFRMSGQEVKRGRYPNPPGRDGTSPCHNQPRDPGLSTAARHSTRIRERGSRKVRPCGHPCGRSQSAHPNLRPGHDDGPLQVRGRCEVYVAEAAEVPGRLVRAPADTLNRAPLCGRGPPQNWTR